MTGQMMNPDAALEIILSSVSMLGTGQVSLRDSFGRALAEDVRADTDLPPFDNSAMDGYAVIAEDTRGAARDNPVKLKVIGEQPAGKADAGPVTPGAAVRIMTGAPIPAGADAVVIVEDTQSCSLPSEGRVGERSDEVLIYREAFLGANIRRAGEDVTRGQVVMRKGTVITPAGMGMLASVGAVEVSVFRKPRTAIITTGDELVDASERPGPGQIRNGNQYSLLGQALRAGCEVSTPQRTSDDKQEIERVLSSAAETADIVIVCGGVSVGDYDYVKDVLDKLGEMRFWKTAIKPGMPLAFGHIGGKPVFGLPGNPVSCMVCFDIYIRPAIRRMMGDESKRTEAVRGMVTDDIRHKPGRREFIRAVTTYSLPSQGRVGERSDGGYTAKPIPKHGSGMLSSMVEANSYIVVREDSGDLSAGDEVEIVLFD